MAACSGGSTLGDAHVRGERTGLFSNVQHITCTLSDALYLDLDDRTDGLTTYRIDLPAPPDATRHPVFGTLERSLADGPVEHERSVSVYADASLGDPLDGGVVVYLHQLVVPRSGDLYGRMDQVVLGCSR